MIFGILFRKATGRGCCYSIEGLPGVKFLRPPSHSKSSYWGGVLVIDRDEAGIDGPGFAKALVAEGIGAGAPALGNALNWPLFQKLNQNPQAFPNYRSPSLGKGRFDSASCPNVIEMEHRSVRIRLNEFCTAEDIHDMAQAIRKVAQWYRREGS